MSAVKITVPEDPQRPGRRRPEAIPTIHADSLEDLAEALCGPADAPQDDALSPCCQQPISQTQQGRRCQCCGKAVAV